MSAAVIVPTAHPDATFGWRSRGDSREWRHSAARRPTDAAREACGRNEMPVL